MPILRAVTPHSGPLRLAAVALMATATTTADGQPFSSNPILLQVAGHAGSPLDRGADNLKVPDDQNLAHVHGRLWEIRHNDSPIYFRLRDGLVVTFSLEFSTSSPVTDSIFFEWQNLEEAFIKWPENQVSQLHSWQTDSLRALWGERIDEALASPEGAHRFQLAIWMIVHHGEAWNELLQTRFPAALRSAAEDWARDAREAAPLRIRAHLIVLQAEGMPDQLTEVFQPADVALNLSSEPADLQWPWISSPTGDPTWNAWPGAWGNLPDPLARSWWNSLLGPTRLAGGGSLLPGDLGFGANPGGGNPGFGFPSGGGGFASAPFGGTGNPLFVPPLPFPWPNDPPESEGFPPGTSFPPVIPPQDGNGAITQPTAAPEPSGWVVWLVTAMGLVGIRQYQAYRRGDRSDLRRQV
jgi:hypothetical protein